MFIFVCRYAPEKLGKMWRKNRNPSCDTVCHGTDFDIRKWCGHYAIRVSSFPRYRHLFLCNDSCLC